MPTWEPACCGKVKVGSKHSYTMLIPLPFCEPAPLGCEFQICFSEIFSPLGETGKPELVFPFPEWVGWSIRSFPWGQMENRMCWVYFTGYFPQMSFKWLLNFYSTGTVRRVSSNLYCEYLVEIPEAKLMKLWGPHKTGSLSNLDIFCHAFSRIIKTFLKGFSYVCYIEGFVLA